MRIVELAPFEEPVPPRMYGGTELVVANITEGLVKRGHDVFLVASADSTTSAALVPISEKSFRELYPRTKYSEKEIEELRSYWRTRKSIEAIEMIKTLKPDIVHNHIGWRAVLLSPLIGCPIMTTLHGPLTPFKEMATFADYPTGNYISISNNQRLAMPDINWIGTVHNGIDVSAFEVGNGDGGYFAFLGRANPEKGLAEICRLVRKTSHKLKIAAKIDSVDVEYFEKEVRPHIDGVQIEFLGEVDHKGKNELLKNALALLVWLNWEEPFGLAVIEAMACGTPVIATKRGSMPELVVDGVTGFLVNSLEEMSAKLDEVNQIDRVACRRHIENNFSVDRMVLGYIDLAEKLINAKQ